MSIERFGMSKSTTKTGWGPCAIWIGAELNSEYQP
jgi:hypothetical protein